MFHKKDENRIRRVRFFTAFRRGLLVFLLSLPIGASLCPASAEIDKDKYIPFDQVKPGMKGYCLTVYKGTAPEKFEMEVVSVVRNIMPGRNAILVQSSD